MASPPIDRVAVVGAGISGVVSAAYLLATGVKVTVFERSKAAGGIWLYDSRQAIEPPYPSINPSEAERYGIGPESNERKMLEHAPPGPCYDGLTNNVSTPLLQLKLNAWPDGTPDFVRHTVIKDYIQDTSKKTGVDEITLYGTRVKDVHKTGSTWRVTWSSLHEDVETGQLEERKETDDFDAVIVASGHYHAPFIPDIPGLKEVKAKWPSRITHSKTYRRPDRYMGKNVFLIGGGVSATDIARELGQVAKAVFQSTRNGYFDLPATTLPGNAVRVGEINFFELDPSHDKKATVSDDEPVPLIVNLKSGERLCDIHQVIVCTGYHIALPFLKHLNEYETNPAEASNTVLVTSGIQVHNLHKDIFYIPDPTLAFVGIPFYTATFSLFEFQAIIVAAVFSGVARLPSKERMREEYRERVRLKGNGRVFHSLKNVEESYVDEALAWVNSDRVALGFPPVKGHSATWKTAKEAQRERLQALFAGEKESSNDLIPVTKLPQCT